MLWFAKPSDFLFKLHHSKSGISWLVCRPTCFLIVTQVHEKHPHKVCMFSKPFWATVSQSRFTFNNHLLNLCPIKVASFQELPALILITGCQAEETGSMCQACHREMFYPHLSLSILSGWENPKSEHREMSLSADSAGTALETEQNKVLEGPTRS